ncbi:MAG: peptide-methionine (S)-S-oxide reductase MsrA [Candidatus Paceibacterota bacterium]
MNEISHRDLNSAIFAGGCFWCVEADFKKRPAIKNIESGYIGGDTEDPSYETAAANRHREAVRVWYDPNETSYRELLAYFFTIHDPTDSGGSFYDRGHSYTSAVYCQNRQEEDEALAVIEALEEADVFPNPIVTEVLPADDFWTAEEYHQNYADKNPEHYEQYRQESGREDFIADHRDAVYEALGL